MAGLKRWIPFKRGEQPTTRGNALAHGDPVTDMQRDMARMFETFWSDPFSGLERWFGDYSPARFTPTIDVSDEGKHLRVSAELPGMSPEDVEVNVQNGALMLRGEKKHEDESRDEDRGYYHTERSYGFFQRSVPLPSDVDADHAEATFRNGVLDVRLPKVESKESGKRLQIKAS